MDLYHARQHLHSLARSLEFMLRDHYSEWLQARLEDLGYGYSDGIQAAVREFPLEGTRKTETEKELGHLPQQRAPHALQVGSGSAACSSAPASSRPDARASLACA